MNFPKDLQYTRTHEWIRYEGESAYIGITDYAQAQLGDLVFVNLPEAGDEVMAGEPFGDVESVKAVSDINAPVTGVVEEANEALADTPEAMNEDPYEAWLIKVGEISATVDLMDAEAYEAFVAEEG